MSEFGPSQVAVSLFFDHSGQDLYENPAPSVFNSTGLTADYAPWPYVQIGVFAGADEFDVGVPDAQKSDTSKHSFNSDYQLLMGAEAKLATPRFLSNKVRLVAYGSGAYLNNSDDPGNVRKGFAYTAGGNVQVAPWKGLNLVLGGEFYAIDGEQVGARDRKTQPFGVSSAAITDYMRGLVGVEYFFKGPNRPFISVSFRPTGAIGWDDQLGLRNGSVCVSLGAIATLPGKGKDKGSDEEQSVLDE
jgi:hypothetical protein